MSRRIIDIILAALFVLFAVVQWNDPDSLVWMIMYALVALVAGLAASGRLFPIATMIMLIVLIVVLLSYIPSIREWFGDGMPSITSSMKAESPYIELVREFFGLLISAAAIAYYVVRGRRIG